MHQVILQAAITRLTNASRIILGVLNDNEVATDADPALPDAHVYDDTDVGYVWGAVIAKSVGEVPSRIALLGVVALHIGRLLAVGTYRCSSALEGA